MTEEAEDQPVIPTPFSERLTRAQAGTLTLGLRRESDVDTATLSWLRGTLQTLEPLADLLHPIERARFDAMQFPRRRHSYLVGRLASRLALCRAVGPEALRDISIGQGIFTQPVLEGGPSSIGLTLAHTDGVAAAIVHPAGHPMGIDLEWADPQRIDAMRRQMSDTEADAALALDVPPAVALTAIWGAKEALSKILRTGMMCPFEFLETCAVSPTSSGLAGEYTHFGQYRFEVTCYSGGLSLAIALPRRTTLVGDLRAAPLEAPL